MKQTITLILFFLLSMMAARTQVVQTHTFFSPALGVEKSLRVYLPEHYELNTSLRYPVVYFLRLHENEWFNPVWRTTGKTLKHVADDLINAGTIGKVIIVAPSTGGNNANPNFTDFGIVNMLRPDLADDAGIGTGAFEDYIIQDLIPYIDSTFRTIPEQCARGVDGFSLGGYASTLYAIKHPGVFSSVGSYDGTIMWYNLDYPVTPGPLDDYSWFYLPYQEFIEPMFDVPFDTMYMKANSASNILMAADSTTLDSIREISFHITAGAIDATTNKEVNEQFIDILASKGINNTFDNLVLAPNAVHTYDWADIHAKETLVKHWDTFSTWGCSIFTADNEIVRPTSAQSLQLSPNPTTGEIFVRLPPGFSISPDMSMTIFDLSGRACFHAAFNKTELRFDLGGLAAGMYWVEVRGGEKRVIQKVVLQK